MKQNRNTGEKSFRFCNPVIKNEAKLDFQLNIKEFSWSEKQKALIEVLLNKKTKIVFIEGCAGTGKTLLAAYCGLQLLANHKIEEILYYRTAVECTQRSLGFLPGTVEEKFGLYANPLIDKLDELLPKLEGEALIKSKIVKAAPINFLRGASINNKFLILDEMQNATIREATTVLTRIGEFSKFVCLGDSKQSDIGNKNSCFGVLSKLFDDDASRENGIHSFTFGVEDVVRSEILKFVLSKLETLE